MNTYEIINKLAIPQHQFINVAEKLFNIDNLPPDLISYLYVNNAELHVHIAEYHYTPIDILIELSKNKRHDHVRLLVAENPNTPIDVLIKLSKDVCWLVRGSVARNPNTPVNILIELCKDINNSVRKCSLFNRTNRISLLK